MIFYTPFMKPAMSLPKVMFGTCIPTALGCPDKKSVEIIAKFAIVTTANIPYRKAGLIRDRLW